MLSHKFDHYLRLEPDVAQRDFQTGIAAAIQDPLWLLCRQWQIGEHQGENASTPVRVTYHATHTELESSAADPRDPTRIPAEAIIEAEPNSWWTLGRRIAYGARFVAEQVIEIGEADRLRFLPPPYNSFENAPDGLALWQRGAVQAANYPEISGDAMRQAWSSLQLLYNTEFDNAERQLQVDRHAGGMVDWYSADGNPDAELAPVPDLLPEGVLVLPAQVQYPGAPHSRWWEIEDVDTDIAGFPPDRSQFPTMLLIDLVVAHSDDWFLFPVSTKIGHIATLHRVTVRDGFDEDYDLTFIDSSVWSLFKTTGLRDTSLVIWSAALTPLQSAPLENVQFGIDEDTNLLWAVERRLSGRDIHFTVPEQPLVAPPDAPLKTANTAVPKSYRYLPGTGARPFWHPYSLEENEIGRHFRQARLDAVVFPNVEKLPEPRAAVLHGDVGIHEVATDAVPSNGIEIERCWMLARDVEGNPILWLQRQRKPLRSPPARLVRFDVLEETFAEQEP